MCIRDSYGRDSLQTKLKDNKYHELVGLMLDERVILRQGQEIYLDENKSLKGIVTSGTYSPTLKRPIALARIPRMDVNNCFAEVRDKKVFAKIGSPRFIRDGKEIFKERL